MVATEDCKLQLYENGEIRVEITNVFGPESIGFAVHSILPQMKGFICGGDGGFVTIYEKVDDNKEFYRKTREFATDDRSVRIRNMTLSPSEDNLLCTLDSCQILNLTLSSAESMKGEEIKFENLTQSFHHGHIYGMDTCIRKPLIGTCSQDKSVRVWNYVDNTCDLVKYFNEEPVSMAIHPSGLYILVGFEDKLRLMNLLIDDIRAYKEFPIKGCREVN